MATRKKGPGTAGAKAGKVKANPARTKATRDPRTTLTPAQSKFMDHLLAGLSVPEAYDRAGVDARQAYKWLQRPDFAAVLESGREALRETLGIERERIVLEHCRIAFANAADFFTAEGRVKPVDDWTPAMRASVREIEVFEEFSGVGEDRVLDGHTKKIKFHDKQKALDALAKLIGVDAAPKAPVGPDGKPVQAIAGYVVVPMKELTPEAAPGDIIEGHIEAVRGKTG